MKPELRAKHERVSANLISMRDSWGDDAPSPETMDDFFYAISKGEITDKKLKLMLGINTNHSTSDFLSPGDAVRQSFHILSEEII